MNAIFMAALVDTVVAPAHNEIYVHEWGLVSYRDGVAEAVGAPDESSFERPAIDCVEAPVIHIWDPEFDGTLTVRSPGSIVSVWPVPDEQFSLDAGIAGGGSAIQWSGLTTICPYSLQVVPWSQAWSIPGFGWASDIWRTPECLVVHRQSDGFYDKFLYYEVQFPGRAAPLPLDTGSGNSPADSWEGDVLVFRKDELGVVSLEIRPSSDLDALQEESMPAGRDFSREEVIGTLEKWAGSLLKPVEIWEMWSTWEPYVTGGDWEGPRLVLFPLPQSHVERISTLELTDSEGRPVFYSRFFLGMAEI